MKTCWDVNNKIPSSAIVALIFVTICIFNCISEASLSSSPIKYLTTVGIIAFPFVFGVLLTAIVCARRYCIDATGMTVCYPFGIKKKYFWNEFSEIALCKIHYAAWGTDHIVAIRCVIGEEKHGPKQAVVGKEWWTRMEYEAFHFGKVISIYRTEERMAEFHKLCPLPIADYRHLEDRS